VIPRRKPIGLAVMPEDRSPPAGGPQQVEQHPNAGSLARAVQPEEAQDLALGHLQPQVRYRSETAVSLRKSVERNGRHIRIVTSCARPALGIREVTTQTDRQRPSCMRSTTSNNGNVQSQRFNRARNDKYKKKALSDLEGGVWRARSDAMRREAEGRRTGARQAENADCGGQQ